MSLTAARSPYWPMPAAEANLLASTHSPRSAGGIAASWDPAERKRMPDTQVVTLVKTLDLAGNLPLGSRQRSQHRVDQPPDAAVARAYALLQRCNPDEVAMCWEVEGS